MYLTILNVVPFYHDTISSQRSQNLVKTKIKTELFNKFKWNSPAWDPTERLRLLLYYLLYQMTQCGISSLKNLKLLLEIVIHPFSPSKLIKYLYEDWRQILVQLSVCNISVYWQATALDYL